MCTYNHSPETYKPDPLKAQQVPQSTPHLTTPRKAAELTAPSDPSAGRWRDQPAQPSVTISSESNSQ